ncbi:MAG: molybdopterin molybdotransferase MoeA [Verrucomicrobiae bacterium]|jgi:molybdopterin molybdotransferase|nr:molybdopterin molybdotransferase MoeA [Verrucomicrobiae bacterium]
MLSLEDALSRIHAALDPLPSEALPVAASAGRILSAPLHAKVDLPAFDNSAMDGYAVRSADVATASTGQPAQLRVIGEVPAGRAFSGELCEGQGIRIFTGSPLPHGADAVVMQEDTRRDGDTVTILEPARPFEHVRLRGEDVRCGQQIGEPGTVVSPGMLNLFAAAGVAELSVSRRPRVALLATGDELCEANASLAPGQIFESNRGMLAELVRRAGGDAEIMPLVADTLEATRDALGKAFKEFDAVITSGGVSVGDHDHVKGAFESLGGSLDFWKVAIKPGKPFVFGRVNNGYLFGLPGNPVSAFVTFLLLVRPALLHWQGARDRSLPIQSVTLGESLANRGDRRHFMRVRVGDDGVARSAGVQGSHMLHSLAVANALVDVPPGAELAAGSRTAALRFDF